MSAHSWLCGDADILTGVADGVRRVTIMLLGGFKESSHSYFSSSGVSISESECEELPSEKEKEVGGSATIRGEFRLRFEAVVCLSDIGQDEKF